MEIARQVLLMDNGVGHKFVFATLLLVALVVISVIAVSIEDQRRRDEKRIL